MPEIDLQEAQPISFNPLQPKKTVQIMVIGELNSGKGILLEEVKLFLLNKGLDVGQPSENYIEVKGQTK